METLEKAIEKVYGANDERWIGPDDAEAVLAAMTPAKRAALAAPVIEAEAAKTALRAAAERVRALNYEFGDVGDERNEPLVSQSRVLAILGESSDG